VQAVTGVGWDTVSPMAQRLAGPIAHGPPHRSRADKQYEHQRSTVDAITIGVLRTHPRDRHVL
jgi:hypothetical protein